MDKYQVIYADPPWHFKLDLDKANVKGHGGGKGIGIDTHYNSMNIQELKNLSIDPYQIVYADPPWKFNANIVNATKNGEAINIDKHYQGMENSDIAALPIKDIIDKDAACFMWTTDAHLPQAIEIMKAWGFTYKTIGFVWVKKTVNNKTVKMLAPWTNKGAELCLFGTKGAMTKHLGANDVFQVHEAVRREHSRKPDIIRDEIKRMFPDCKRIELFARTALPGWDAWGNEVDKFTEPEETKKGLW
jgi:N6-adenosine-specific RNA methylase IME4